MADVEDIWDDDEDCAQFGASPRPLPPESPTVVSDFDKWFYAQKDPNVKLAGKPVTLATALLYRYVGNNVEHYEIVCDLLEQAFNAGKASHAP